MNVLSLFDGISCAKLALNKAKIKVKNYYASEIDKYAIKVSKANHPDIQHIGDVRNVNWFGFPKIDLLLGGSPCQGFSFAGKGLNFEDPRSKLFFDFVRIFKEVKPRYFLLENVPMKKEYENIISEHLGCKPIIINSSLVSAQNRKRLYWSNIPSITQPKDKKIMLKDIIENGVGIIKTMGFVKFKENKAQCLDSNYSKGIDNHGQRTMIMIGKADLPTSRQSDKRVYSIEGKSPTLLANSGGHKEPKIGVIKLGNTNPSGIGQNGNIASVTGKSYAVTTNKGEGAKIGIKQDDIYWRKLTVQECCRLQTIPDNYFDGIVSNSQAYKALGNAWTVDIITHILKGVKD